MKPVPADTCYNVLNKWSSLVAGSIGAAAARRLQQTLSATGDPLASFAVGVTAGESPPNRAHVAAAPRSSTGSMGAGKQVKYRENATYLESYFSMSMMHQALKESHTHNPGLARYAMYRRPALGSRRKSSVSCQSASCICIMSCAQAACMQRPSHAKLPPQAVHRQACACILWRH